MAGIMIADDSDAIRMILKEILSMQKHTIVAEAENGLEAVEKFSQTNPDLLILDLSMPKKEGLSVIREIISKNSDAKIVVLSGSDDKGTIEQCLAAGAQAHIPKPFSYQKVLDTISKILQ